MAANRNSVAPNKDLKGLMNIIKSKVFVMMSGGVDSSVAALLLAKNKKYEVIGCFIKGYNVDGCEKVDAEDARRTAEFLKIPFYAIDLEKEYKKLVVDYMIGGYRKGITPNPDIMCNKEIKFGLFLKKALKMGADFVATGHYVILRNTNQYEYTNSYIRKKFVFRKVFQAKDKNKDQSYFLWTLTQEQLKHCLFPIGDYLKSEVRKIAKKAGLPTAEKKDSQGICFLGKIKFRDFLKRYLPVKKGDILNVEGKKIGKHDGVWFYTIGQRHLNMENRKAQSASNKPLYVVEKNIKKNVLIVAEGENNPVLYKKEIKLTDVNFINPKSVISLIRANKGTNIINILARVRYRQPLAGARLCFSEFAGYKLFFDKPQKFVASGQSAVFYNKNGEMLGGGIITD